MAGCYGVNLQVTPTVVMQCAEFDVPVAQDIGVGGVASLVGLYRMTESEFQFQMSWIGVMGLDPHLNTSFQYSLTKSARVKGMRSAAQSSLTRERSPSEAAQRPSPPSSLSSQFLMNTPTRDAPAERQQAVGAREDGGRVYRSS